MARTVQNYSIQDQGRDFGKVFRLTEMPAARAEAWAMRALLAIMQGNVDLPEGFERLGMAGMMQVGLVRGLMQLKWDVAEPLLEEMWSCVQIIPDPSKPNIVRNLIEEDIEEVTTRVKIRAELWKLHGDFWKAAVHSISEDSQPAAAKKKSMRNM
jgi:hypothetical protein